MGTHVRHTICKGGGHGRSPRAIAVTVADALTAKAERPFDARFATVVASALAYFIGLGILAPVLPRYIEDVLDGGGTAVGVAVGAFAVTAALLRPWVGRVGDRRGRRVLLVGGALVAAVATLGYGLPGGLAVLVLFRLLAGAGEAAAFIGAATTAQDLAPPGRRGQAASLFSISVYGGLAFGPVIGDWVYTEHGPGWAWVAAAAASLLGAAIALALPARLGMPERTAAAPPSPVAGGWRRWLHPAGLGPGVILALGASGYAGFASFVPLYVDEIGLDGAGPVFFEYGAIVLAVRIVASWLPDRLGTRRGPLAALALQAAGLLLMAAWASPAGLYSSTAIYAAGVSLLYPALCPAVVDAAPEAERSQAIATFTLFFDLSQGLGAPLLGSVVSLTEERGAFAGAAALSAAGLVVHHLTTRDVRHPVGEPCPPAEPGG
jgi:MFS family permease